ncbi:MAG: acylphosphatase [Rhodanobacteraceae bacterium]
MACARFIVRGRVQGVFFRASTREQALRLGLTGYAKNLANGDVEVLACGSSEALEELQRWLHRGPPSARVEGVTRAALPEQTIKGFTMC